MALIQTRRGFIAGLGATAGLAGIPSARADEQLETTRVRLTQIPALCVVPQYMAEELLQAEGFTEIRYVDTPVDAIDAAIGDGKADFGLAASFDHIQAIDAGAPVSVLTGLHGGCFELFGGERVRSIGDLKGKTVGIEGLGHPHAAFVSIMAAYVGLDPRKDVRWVTPADPKVRPLDLFVERKVDAFLGFPPEPQELRARKAGHVIVNTGLDLPWSQYYCCMLAGNREFTRRNPVATKRVLRALLKAADLCAAEPLRAAQRIFERGFTTQYAYAEETLRTVAYDKWRDYDAEDTIRFYALRLHEAELIKSSPQKIIADGTDWRFLNELKRELKA
jgi:NitT/TauT family transport system substrate-binding protein